LLSSISAVKLSEWARRHGISYLTAWRWFKAGKLPVPARQLPSGTILVEEPLREGRTVLYARVASPEQRADLERQMERLKAFALAQGWRDFEVVAEIGSGLNGKRRKLLRVLKDPTVGRIVVEHRDRLVRFGFELVEAALHASGKRIVVVEEGEVKDDLVRDLLKVLTSACERPMKRSARNRAKRALEVHGMWVNQAFRFELSPNATQRRALAQHIGAARFAYNWGLEMALRALEEGRRLPSAPELHKAWNVWKRENAPRWTEVSKCAPQEAFRDLEKALKNWKAKRARFPRFKRKKSLDDNKARLTGTIKVFSRQVQLPRIGLVKTKERTDKLVGLIQAKKARILSATVSREADRFYVSLTCEVERPDTRPKEVRSEGDIVGIDLGLSSFATSFPMALRIDAPKPLAKKLRLLKRRSQTALPQGEGLQQQQEGRPGPGEALPQG
jgi:predicted site-specific integrase-resolvase